MTKVKKITCDYCFSNMVIWSSSYDCHLCQIHYDELFTKEKVGVLKK